MGEVTKQGILEKRIDSAIENGKEFDLLIQYWAYTTKKGERTERDYINFVDSILDEYNRIKNKYGSQTTDKTAKYLSIYNHLKNS